eukprot:2139635-Pyramimonas_sp.AAC.1
MPPAKTKLVRPHAPKAGLRRETAVMCMDAVVNEMVVQIEVLGPTHQCDELLVAYMPEALAALVRTMRTMGFDEPQKRARAIS